MTIPINIETLPNEQQYRLYKFLKNKFDYAEKKEVMSMELQDLYYRREIGTRTIHQLKRLRINTIQDLANCQRSMFYGIRGIGDKSLVEIESILHKYGLEFTKE